MTRASVHGSRVCAALVLAVALAAGAPAPAWAHHDEVVDKLDRGTAQRVSVSTTGTEGNRDSGTSGFSASETCLSFSHFSASDDGRIVAFASRAGNLHPSDANEETMLDVFAYDRKTRRLELVSTLPSGLSPIGEASSLALPCRGSFSPVVSGNGRFIAFVSNQPLAGDLVQSATPTNKVFVHDLRTRKTELVSATWDGKPALGSSEQPAISDNGRFVAFTSTAPNLIEDNPCTPVGGGIPSSLPFGCRHVFARDRQKDETVLVSRSSEGEPANFFPSRVFISGNGRFVAFDTSADNLVENDLNKQCTAFLVPSCADVFRHDLRTQKTELVSVGRGGTSGNFISDLPNNNQQAISDDGDVIVFRSSSSDLVPGNPPTPPVSGLASLTFVRDMKSGRTERVSVSSAGAMLGSQSLSHSISDDGRYVSWYGWTCDAHQSSVQCPDHHEAGAFVHDRKTGQTDWVTTQAPGTNHRKDPGPAGFLGIHLGGNARFLLDATHLAHYGNDKNEASDVFIRDLGMTHLGVYLGDAASPWDRVSIPGDTRFNRSGVITAGDARDDAAVPLQGAEILEMTLAYRPELDDLYVRIDVERIEPDALASPLIYGVRFATHGTTYEVRASGGPVSTSLAKVPFELFKCGDVSGSSCTKISDLRGGYGTTGERIVFSLPLQMVGLRNGGELADFEAFTGFGSQLTGIARMLDTARFW